MATTKKTTAPRKPTSASPASPVKKAVKGRAKPVTRSAPQKTKAAPKTDSMTDSQDDQLLIEYPEEPQESEDDLVGQVSLREAVINNTDWTVESINLQIDKGTVDLQPSFQRRGAWDRRRKSRLIESLIVGMPVPNLVLAEQRDHRGRFIVIDGKQRLLSIREFISGEYKLTGLDLRPDLNQCLFDELDSQDREAFENSTIRTSLIKGWTDEKFLWAAFYRLNVGSLPLSPQELRRALIGGKLLEQIEEYLVTSTAYQAVFGTALDKRMRDSELVLRFLAFDRDLSSYRGDFRRFLDDTTQYYEQDWRSRRPEALAGLARLDRVLETSYFIFEENAFKKWKKFGFERIVNRAVFDCVARYFAEEKIASAARKRREAVIDAYMYVCSIPEFRDAIERTTKTNAATEARLRIWGEQLATVLGKKFDQAGLRIG